MSHDVSTMEIPYKNYGKAGILEQIPPQNHSYSIGCEDIESSL